MLGSKQNSLFNPVEPGALNLKHRVVMAPLTRSRSVQPDSVPGDLMKTHYEQRAPDGGLIITEAANISLTSRGWLGAPGLYSDEQVKGWKAITSAVKAKGGHMFAQLWHTGRSSHVAITGGAQPVTASVHEAYWKYPSHLVSIPGGWVQPSPYRALTAFDKFHSAFAADVTDDEAAIMAAVQRPLAVAAFAGIKTSVAWKQIPSWYLVCTDDQTIPQAAQLFMASRMNDDAVNCGEPCAVLFEGRRGSGHHRASCEFTDLGLI